jgi:hypothetical protein
VALEYWHHSLYDKPAQTHCQWQLSHALLLLQQRLELQLNLLPSTSDGAKTAA